MSLGSLIQGFQQGYRFVDDIDRQNKEDQYKDEVRGRQRKEWAKDDDAEAERQALYQKYFGKKEEAPAAKTPAMMAAEQGIPLPPQPVPETEARPATPVDGQMVPASADSGMGPAITAWGGRPAPTLAEIRAPKSTAGAGRGYINPPAATPAPEAGTSTAGAGRGMVNPAPVMPAVTGGDSVAGAGRGFVNPPVVTAADRSVAPGKIDITNMTPDQRAKLNALAEKQFALRPSAGGMQPVVYRPGADVAASQGVETAIKTDPSRKDPMSDMNNVLAFAMESAKIDVKRGKMDGTGLATLAKTVEAMKREGMDRAIVLMGQGRFQEAQDAFNAQGDHTGVTIVSSRDATFKIGKTEVPSKIVTLKKEDGTTRTINTAEAQYQMMDMKAQLDAAFKDRGETNKEEETKARREDTAARLAETASYHAESAADRRERTGLLRRQVELAEEKLPPGPKLPDAVTQALKPLQTRLDNKTKAIDKAMAEDNWNPDSANAKAMLADQRALQVQIREMISPYLADTKAAPRTDPLGIRSVNPGDSAQPEAPKATPAAAAATKGTGTGAPAEPAKPKESWSETVAKKEAAFKTASERKAKADSDPELQALQQKKKDAAAKGDLPAARQALREHDELKAKRYGQ